MSVTPSGVMAIVLLECFRVVEFGESTGNKPGSRNEMSIRTNNALGCMFNFSRIWMVNHILQASLELFSSFISR